MLQIFFKENVQSKLAGILFSFNQYWHGKKKFHVLMWNKLIFINDYVMAILLRRTSMWKCINVLGDTSKTCVTYSCIVLLAKVF